LLTGIHIVFVLIIKYLMPQHLLMCFDCNKQAIHIFKKLGWGNGNFFPVYDLLSGSADSKTRGAFLAQNLQLIHCS